jgi:orotate phosphoribosyltransferase
MSAKSVLHLCDREEQAEEHFKKYEMSTVRIAAEDEIYYYRSKGCPVVEL